MVADCGAFTQVLARRVGNTQDERGEMVSKAEDQFAKLWLEDGPIGFHLVREYKFCDDRKWRFDFAEVPHKVAIEIEGVIYRGRGRHQGADGFRRDCEKYNYAAANDWIVLRFIPSDIKNNPDYVIETVERALETAVRKASAYILAGTGSR